MRDTKTERNRGLGFYNPVYGFGILFVVIIHTIPKFITFNETGQISNAISVFGNSFMVLFFLLSGFGIYTTPWKQSLLLHFKTILVPYCLTATSVILTKLGIAAIEHRPFLHHGGEYLLTYLLGINYEGGGTLWNISVDSISTLWFLLALFEARIIYNNICRLNNEKMIIILSACCSIAGYIMMSFSEVWLFVLNLGFMGVGWIAMGNFIHKYKVLDKKLPIPFYILLSAITIYLICFSNVSLVDGIMESGIVDLVGISCFAFLLLKASDKILLRRQKVKHPSILGSIGCISIYILCVHAYDQKILPLYRIGSIFQGNGILQALFALMIRIGFIFVACLFIYAGKELWHRLKNRNRKKITIEFDKEVRHES